ncbi:MAG: hypothetical protein ABSB69_06020 [Solirubrobacteraceae bacterium]
MDVWEYFQTREREIDELSMSIFPGIHPFGEEEGNDQRGRIFCLLSFHGYDPNEVFFQLHEEVVVRGVRCHAAPICLLLGDRWRGGRRL